MTALILPSRGLMSQPQGPVSVDWSNPITRDLIDYAVPNVSRLDNINAGRILATSGGLGYSSNGGSASGWQKTSPIASIDSTKPITILASVSGAAGSTDNRIYGLATASGYILYVGSGLGNASKMRLWIRTPSADIGSVDTTATVFEAGVPHVGVLRYTPGLIESFVDGKVDATSAGTAIGTTSGTMWSGAGTLYRGSASGFNASSTLAGMVFARALSNAEVASLSANPWQIFKQPSKYIDIQPKQFFAPTQSKMLGTSIGQPAAVASVGRVRGIRTAQPQGVVGIDWSNPVTRGLSFAPEFFGSSRLLDQITGASAKILGTGISVLDRTRGRVVVANGSSVSGDCSFGVINPLASAVGVTFTCRIATADTTSTLFKPFAQWGGASRNIFLVQQQGSGKLGMVLGDSGGGVRRGGQGAVFSANNTFVDFAFTWSATGNVVQVYANGVPVTTTDFASTGTLLSVGTTPVAGTNPIQVGSAVDGGPFNGMISEIRLWRRALSLVEVKSLSDNPWQIFTPTQRNIWVPYP